MGALEQLQAKFGCQMLFVESGGDNLAANYSRELADYIIYVIDVAVSLSFADDDLDVEGAEATQVQKLIFAVLKGGDKIPRKGGPGISQSDLLVINKARPKNILMALVSSIRSLSQLIHTLSFACHYNLF